MIERQLYTGILEPNFLIEVKDCIKFDIGVLPKEVMMLSVFGWENYLFLYVEWDGISLLPESYLKRLGDCMKTNHSITGSKQWTRMADVFHYNYPVNLKQWQRPHNMTPVARLGMLKYEKISSYIYYHYQYQEELPGDGNKYFVIAMTENILFMYTEEPEIIEPTIYPGELSSKSSHENWSDRMGPHFIGWEDLPKDLFWRELVCYGNMQRY
jgi:hypothetical protein